MLMYSTQTHAQPGSQKGPAVSAAHCSQDAFNFCLFPVVLC